MMPTLKSIHVEPVDGQPAGEPVFLIDSRGNLIIEQGEQRLTFTAAGALELLKFLDRTGYQAHANSIAKGVPA